MITKDYKGPAHQVTVSNACYEVIGVNIQAEHVDIQVKICDPTDKTQNLFQKNYHYHKSNDTADRAPFKKYFAKDALKGSGKEPWVNAEDCLLEFEDDFSGGKKVADSTASTSTTSTSTSTTK